MANKVKKHYAHGFTTVSTTIFLDKNLSFKAKGLLCQMFSFPADWEYSEAGISAVGRDSRDSVRSGLKELEENRYLWRERVRDSEGKLKNTIYHFYDEPFGENEHPMSENPTLENPTLDTPTLESRHNKVFNNKILNNKECMNKEQSAGFSETEKDNKLSNQYNKLSNQTTTESEVKISLLINKYIELTGKASVAPIILDKIGSCYDDFGFEWTSHAIDIAEGKGVTNFSYIEGILVKWADKFKKDQKPWILERPKNPMATKYPNRFDSQFDDFNPQSPEWTKDHETWWQKFCEHSSLLRSCDKGNTTLRCRWAYFDMYFDRAKYFSGKWD